MAASAADLGSAREGILQRMERLKESLAIPARADEGTDMGGSGNNMK